VVQTPRHTRLLVFLNLFFVLLKLSEFSEFILLLKSHPPPPFSCCYTRVAMVVFRRVAAGSAAAFAAGALYLSRTAQGGEGPRIKRGPLLRLPDRTHVVRRLLSCSFPDAASASPAALALPRPMPPCLQLSRAVRRPCSWSPWPRKSTTCW
jgi:hypothetical protein